MGRPKIVKSPLMQHLVDLDVTLEAFAKKHKLNPTTFRLVLGGHYKPSKDLLKRIVAAYGGKFTEDQVLNIFKKRRNKDNIVKTRVSYADYLYLQSVALKKSTDIPSLVYDAINKSYLRKMKEYDPAKLSSKSNSKRK